MVAQLNSNIDGLWTGHLDRDGTTDAAIWTDEQLILLRGRPAGGYSWGAQFAAHSSELASSAGNNETEESGDQDSQAEDTKHSPARQIVSVNIR